jgi:TetR/AcrR family transcriptional regulator, transcriptional repressor for nem operon
MGRKKSYNRDELIGAAMQLFQTHGFAGTSTQMLVQHLDVNRNSMYSEFTSKEQLFAAALRRYDEHVVTEIFGSLEAPDGDLDRVDALFSTFGAAASGSASGLGCFMCNTAVELAGKEPAGEDLVQRYFERLSAAFKNALDNTRRAGQLAPEVNTLDEARFLTASALGIFVMVRARAAPKIVQAAARVARHHLQSLRAGPK